MFFKIFLLSAALEIGAVNGTLFNYTKSKVDKKEFFPLYTSLEADVHFSVFYVGGAMDCYFIPLSLTQYSPFQMTYIFNAGIKSGNVQIGYEHSCFHPMQPYSTIIGNEIKPKYEGGYNRFYVHISTK